MPAKFHFLIRYLLKKYVLLYNFLWNNYFLFIVWLNRNQLQVSTNFDPLSIADTCDHAKPQ